MIMSLFLLKVCADNVFLVSNGRRKHKNRTLLYYNLFLLVTAVLKGWYEILDFIGTLGGKRRMYTLFIPLKNRIGNQDVGKRQKICLEN